MNSQWARGRKWVIIGSVQTHRGRVVFLLVASFPTIFFTTQEHSTTNFSYLLKKIRFRGSCAKWNLKKLVNLPKQIAFEGKRFDFCEIALIMSSEDVWQHLLDLYFWATRLWQIFVFYLRCELSAPQGTPLQSKMVYKLGWWVGQV